MYNASADDLHRRQRSPALYDLNDQDGSISISTNCARAKVANVRRDPRVALYACGDDLLQYVVVEGSAQVVDRDALPLLRRTYQRIVGRPHPDWEELDRAMVREQRVVLAIRLERLHPLDR